MRINGINGQTRLISASDNLSIYSLAARTLIAHGNEK